MLTDYTTPDEIRAVLSVTDEELEDDHLNLPLFTLELSEKFRELSVNIEALYLTYHAAGTATLSPNQLRFYNLSRLFATYSVAVHLLDSYDLLAVQTVKDARAEFARFEKPFERVGAAIRASWEKARLRLTQAYNEIAAVPATFEPAAARVFVATAGIAADPVTNQ